MQTRLFDDDIVPIGGASDCSELTPQSLGKRCLNNASLCGGIKLHKEAPRSVRKGAYSLVCSASSMR